MGVVDGGSGRERSRRHLLKIGCGSFLAGTGVCLDLRSVAAANSEGLPREWPSFEFLVVTDTHLGYREKTGAERQWEKTAAQLAEANGEFLLHLGDVVDRGQEPQYAIYRRIRDTIGKPVHEIPGNHDPVDLFEKHLEVKADRVVDHGGVRFILMGNAHRDSHDGFFTAEQIAWLEARCREAVEEELWVIIAAHVPVHANRPPDRAWYVKPENGQTAFYETLDRFRGRVLALFHGHFHNGIRGWDDRAPLHEVLFPSALYNLDRGLEAKGAPGYNLAEFRPGYVAAAFSEGKLTLRYCPVGETPGVEKVLRWQGG